MVVENVQTVRGRALSEAWKVVEGQAKHLQETHAEKRGASEVDLIALAQLIAALEHSPLGPVTVRRTD